MKAIYVIINKFNGKRYIGSAKNFYKRKQNHFSQLKHNKHKNIHLQRSYNKHGKNAFEMLVIEKINFDEDLLLREQYWIDNTKPEYNINPIVNSWLGRKHSNETKEKIRLAKLGSKHSEESKLKIGLFMKNKKHTAESKLKMSLNRNHPIYQYDNFGNLIKIWKNSALAARELGLNYRHLQRIAQQEIKKSKFSGGFIWRYK